MGDVLVGEATVRVAADCGGLEEEFLAADIDRYWVCLYHEEFNEEVYDELMELDMFNVIGKPHSLWCTMHKSAAISIIKSRGDR